MPDKQAQNAHNYTTGTLHLFDFEPEDGVSYRVMFGRMPPVHWLQQACIVFGFAEGRDALITVIFDTDSINDETFGRHWQTATHAQTVNNTAYLERSAYAVFCALVGYESYQIVGWKQNWREELPVAALG